MDARKSKPNDHSRPADLRWLLAGAALGLVAAGFGLLQRSDTSDVLPENSIARVNEQLIERGTFERALQRLAAERGGTTNEQDAAWLLQRLIDEELLIQRGLELGMAASDSEVRNAIVNSLVASVTAESDAMSVSDEELQRYLEGNANKYSFTATIAVAAWQSDAESDAQRFVTALRENGALPTSEKLRPIVDLPEGLMSIEILGGYLGPGIAAAAADMPIGGTAIFARRGRWLVVHVLQKETSAVTDLSTVRNRVLLDYRRSLADTALEDYLDGLKSQSEITVSLP